ncbi:MAG TPA: AI-2E family transporter [Acidisarcina sp.]|nr:AI-2E family transporter [Acidisarcina sp.]
MSSTRIGFLAGDPLLLIAAIVLVLYFAQALLIPLALALTLYFLLAPAVSLVERLGIPRSPAVIIVVVAACCIAGSIGWVVEHQLVGVAEELPAYRANIRAKLEAANQPSQGSLRQALQSLEEIGVDVLSGGSTATPRLGRTPAKAAEVVHEAPTRVVIVQPPESQFYALRDVMLRALRPLATGVIVLVFTLYMLAKREDLRNRLLLLAGISHISLMSRALEDASTRISQYLVLQFLVNAAYAVCFGIALFAIGVPNATLWGVIAGLFRFIPYIGTTVGCVFPVIYAFAVFVTWWPPLLILAVFLVLELITANFVEPQLYGSHTGISSLALLATAIFWAVLWGWPGLVLATPLTVCLIVMGRYVPQLSFLHTLLGDEAELAPAARFYERLLAMDRAEAHDIADRFLAEHSLQELYDSVLIPALTLAEEDRIKGSLREAQSNFLFLSASELVAELSEFQEPRSTKENAERPSEDEESWKRCAVICIPADATDRADELTAMMIAQLLEHRFHHTLLLSPASATPEVLSKLAEEPRTVICISALPPFAFSTTRALCQTIRQQLHDNRIVIGLWNAADDERKQISQFGSGRPDAVLNSLDGVLAKIEEWDSPPPDEGTTNLSTDASTTQTAEF